MPKHEYISFPHKKICTKHYEISMPADAAENEIRNTSVGNPDIAYGNLHDAFQYAGLVKDACMHQ